MKRLLIFLFLVMPCFAQWQIGQRNFTPSSAGYNFGTVDTFTPLTGQTIGAAITTMILANGTHPTSSPPCTWTMNGTGLLVGASQGALGGTVTVGATTYPANNSSQSISVPDSGSITTAICNFSTSSKIASSFAYINNTVATNTTSDVLYDRDIIYDTSGAYISGQLQNGEWHLSGGGLNWNIETAPGGTTTHTGFIPAVPNQRYGVGVCYNAGTGVTNLYIYIPLATGQLGLVGSATASYGAHTTNVPVGTFTLGNNEGGTSTTPSFIEDFMGQFTSPTCPLVPAPVNNSIPTYVSGAAANATSSTTVAVNYTAASATNSEVAFICTTTSASTLTVSSLHATWTQVAAPTVLNSPFFTHQTCGIWKAFNVGTTADTITAVFGTSGSNLLIDLVETASTSSVDASSLINVTSGSGGTITSASLTPAANPSVAVMWGIGDGHAVGGNNMAGIVQDSAFFSQGTVSILTSSSPFAGQMIDTAGSGQTKDVAAMVLLH